MFFFVFGNQLNHFIACMCPGQFLKKKQQKNVNSFWRFLIFCSIVKSLLRFYFVCWIVIVVIIVMSSILIFHSIYHLISCYFRCCLSGFIFCVCFCEWFKWICKNFIQSNPSFSFLLKFYFSNWFVCSFIWSYRNNKILKERKANHFFLRMKKK